MYHFSIHCTLQILTDPTAQCPLYHARAEMDHFWLLSSFSQKLVERKEEGIFPEMRLSTWTPDETTPRVLVVDVDDVVPWLSPPLARSLSPSFSSTQTDGFLVTDTIWDDLLCRRLQGHSRTMARQCHRISTKKTYDLCTALWRKNGRITGSEEKRRPGTVFGIKSQ